MAIWRHHGHTRRTELSMEPTRPLCDFSSVRQREEFAMALTAQNGRAQDRAKEDDKDGDRENDKA